MNAPMTKHEIVAACDVNELTHTLRSELMANAGDIPTELKSRKAFLLWKTTEINPTTGKFIKIPFYPCSRKNRHGRQGDAADLANLGTWDEAMAALNADKSFAGIGIGLLPEWNIVALDVDHCVVNGKVRDDVAMLIDETYSEISPSGTGIRAFWRGEAKNGKNNATGFELYHSSQFVTITGNWFTDGPIAPLSNEKRSQLETLARSPVKPSKISSTDRIKEAAQNDPRLQAIIKAGLYERDMGGGKHSICCPFEDQHSDLGRSGGDADTVYYQPNTEGYAEGWIHCLHTHGNDQGSYWAKIGYSPLAVAGQAILAKYQSPDGGGWPVPQPIPDDLPPVPLFDLALLPDAFRPWITDIAERMQISPDIPAVGAVTALSSAIGRRVQIRPKANDDWTVVPNLWGCVVAPPGFMKSPALTEVMKPLHRLESEAHHAYESAHTAWEAAKERTAIANKAATSASIAKLKKDPKAEITASLDEPDEPLATRFTVNNFSLEALGEVLKANPKGVLAFSDEIHGLLMMSQKPGNEGLNDFLLSAWAGDGAFTLDRIVRGIRRIQHVCVAVLGGIQPGRLVEHVRGATHGGGEDSGLIQRFQLMVWPDMRGDWKLVDRMPDKAARDAAERVFERVVSPFHALTGAIKTLGGDEDTIDIRRFDTDAQLVFFSWFEELEREIRGHTLPPVMASHLSKYRSLVPSLALIFAVADDVRGAIPLRCLEQAIGWAKYLRPHAERVYACTTHADTRHARALLAKIKDGSITDGFTPRDVYKKGWRLLDKLGVTKATDLLADLDYLLPIETRNPAGGRPSVTFNINPKGIG